MFEITRAPCDNMPFQKDKYTQELPTVASFEDMEEFKTALASMSADWIMSASDMDIRDRAFGLCEFLLPRERLAECRERVESLGWRYLLSIGWVVDGYESEGDDPRFVRVHLVRQTTEEEDEADDYIISGKAKRDRLWRRAGLL